MKKYTNVFVLLIAFSYIIIRLCHFINIPTSIFNDTGSYVSLANLSIFSREFWLGSRPFTYPLLIKLFDFNLNAIVVSQFILSVIVWLFTAFNFSRCLSQRYIKLISFPFILLFSLSTDIILWDRLAQTESLNITLIILLLGLFLYNKTNYKKVPTVIFIIIALFFVFLRDTNAWMALLLGLLIIISNIVLPQKRSRFIIGFSLIVLFLLSNYSANIGRRWVTPFLNVISSRVLTNQSLLHEFELRGIPENDTLLNQKNKNFNNEYLTNPELEKFRTWLYSAGKKSYYSVLLKNPSYLIQAPFENWSIMFGYLPETQVTHNDNLDYAPDNFQEIIPLTVSEYLYPKRYGLVFIFFSLFLIGTMFPKIYMHKCDSIDYFCFAIIICSIPMFLLNYHGDASGISRHAIGSIFQWILFSWLAVIKSLDSFWASKEKIPKSKNIPK